MRFFVRRGAWDFFRWAHVLFFSVISFVLIVASARAQSPNAINDLATRINRERISRGMIPYALNAKLNSAAQVQANDMARTGKYSHIGSDGSTVFDRVARAGYGAYSWGRRLGENWAWFHDPQTAMQMWMGSAPHRNNILHAVYREFGIGVAAAQNGGFIYVVDFGAEPNVLPVFIQDGASDTTLQKITITLSNEDYASSGDGANTIGKATQVQISSSANFSGAQWQPYTSKFGWTLTPGDGTKTIYVKYRDARGRTVTSSDSINADLSPIQDSSPTPKPTLKASPTSTKLKPTPTRTPTPKLIATLTPEAGLTPRETEPPSVTPLPEILTPGATSTDTPVPTETPALESTETPNLGSVAIVVEQTPVGMIDSQDEISFVQVVFPVPSENEVSAQSQVTPIALSVLGMSVMLGVLAFVKWLEHRSDHD